jgi:hypothetical protein
MSFADFIVFALSDVDKTNLNSLRYWFRCCDWDDDGYLSMVDLERLYESQRVRLNLLFAQSNNNDLQPAKGIDTLVEILDLVGPEMCEKISLQDLTVNRELMLETGALFDQCIHLHRSWQVGPRHQPTQSMRRNDLVRNDWDRWAAAEYIRFVHRDYM